jgi:hypothetical protein
MQTISSAARAHHLQSRSASGAWKVDPFARFIPEAGLFSDNQPNKTTRGKNENTLVM